MVHGEKKGGRPRSERLMNNFHAAVESCRLFDLGQKCDFYTSINKHDDNTFTKERLDRTLSNQEWASLYNNSLVESHAIYNSYHKPLLVLYSNCAYQPRKRMKLFRYEANWNLFEDCQRWSSNLGSKAVI